MPNMPPPPKSLTIEDVIGGPLPPGSKFFPGQKVVFASRRPPVPAPACANPRANGPCWSCAYCRATAAGPEWWLLDPAATTAALLIASVAHENAQISEFCYGVAKLFMPTTNGGVVTVPIPSLLQPDGLPQTIAGRLAFATELLQGVPIVDAEGHRTSERTAPLISKATFKRIVEATDPAQRRRRTR